MSKTRLLNKEQKKQLKGEVGQGKRSTGAGKMRFAGFQNWSFSYSSSGKWTDSFD